MGGLVAAPAAAAEIDAVLDITKSVSRTTATPGQSFTYTINVDCSSADCVNARVVDVLPTEFDALTLDPTAAVTGAPASASFGGPNNRTLTVDFQRPLDAGGVGLASGDGPSIQVTFTVPVGLSPNWAANGVAVQNTATVSADNALSKSSNAPVTITVPFTVATVTGATWAPSTTQYKVGEASTLTVTTRNTSNALADSLELLVPVDPAAATNLFDTVTFGGFGALTFPQGADRVQIDAWVNGAWVVGSPSTTAALPLDEGTPVSAADVTGLRIRFTSSTGTTIAPAGSAGSLALDLIQRASTRAASTPLVLGASVTANVRGTVTVPDHGSASQSKTASYVIGPLTSVVSGTTSFAAPVIPAGTGTTATLNGRNDSNGPLASLTLTQPADALLSNPRLTFTALRAGGSAWPAGATAATVRWIVDSGPTPAPTTIAQGDAWPTTPLLDSTVRIVGFSVEYTGSIPVGATATVPFRFEVSPLIVTNPTDIITLPNTTRVDGRNDAGDAAPANPTASMQVIYPQIEVTLDKQISPTAPVPPGGRSVSLLRAQVGTQSGFVRPTSIVITDAAGTGPNDYWSAFDAVAIAPTQIPAGSTLTISTTTAAAPRTDTDWTTFRTVSAPSIATTFADVLPAGLLGVRFEFVNPDGFAQSSAVQGNIAFVARATLRGSGDPVASGGAPTAYLNAATVDAEGQVQLPGGSLVTDEDDAGASGPVIVTPGNGGLLVDKRWLEVSGSVTVSSQSGQQRTARLGWGAQIAGHPTISVSDPADPQTTPVASTVFQAFDLVRIAPITPATDPYIAFDQVTDVELYDGTAWVSVMDDACDDAADCRGRFAGYTLSDAERASTVGVRLTFAEWAGGRGTDPLAPPVGSGVASGPDQRPLDLVFQLRNRVRDAALTPSYPWITHDRTFNAGSPGLVSNDMRVTTGSFTATDSDTMLIIDRFPGVGLTKSASSTALAIPVPGDVAASAYPKTTFTMTARNTSDARAWHLRVTDQMPCSTTLVSDCAHPTVGTVSGSTIDPYAGRVWDPATSPFDAFTIIGLKLPSATALTAAGVSQTTVILWHPDGTTTTHTTAPSTTDLADAVGVSVLFSGVTENGGTIVSGAGLTIEIETQMREFLRSQPTVRTAPGVVQNHAFSQVWDAVLTDTLAYVSASANVTLANAKLDVTATKQFRDAANSSNLTDILERDRATPVGVLLSATPGTATASPRQLLLEDSRAEFWDAFELRTVGAAARPNGSDRMRVLVKLPDGSWTPGAWGASPALPAVTLSDVRGIRFEYDRTDGGIFSVSAPAATWSASAFFTVRLRSAVVSTGAPIAFPSTVPNTVTGTVTNTTWGTASATGNAGVTLSPGTFEVAISKKAPLATSPAGQTLDFTLVMKNTGTGFLDNPVVTDILPADATLPFGGSLLFDPTSEVGYSTSAGGILPTTGQTLAYDDATRRIQITWPAGSRLAPGETYTVVIPLQLAPGLRMTDPAALNTFRFSSDRTLATCSQVSSDQLGVTLGSPATSCSTTAVVGTYEASAISSFKGVKGDVGSGTVSTRGATNVNNAATACVADAQGFYRQPCAANTVVGGTDLWKLQFINGGNIDATTATIVDVLPTPGDKYLRSVLARGSAYTPVFAGDVQLATAGESTGTTIQWDVTTTPTPCANYDTDPTCATATWVSGSTFPAASYGQITAVRIRFDFTAATGGVLKPGASAAVTYRTVNTPTTSAGDNRAPVAASVAPVRAWNTFGVFARFTNNDDRRVEPARAGVQLATGSIQASKAIAGVSAAYAPTSYSATASCTVAGVPVPLPASGAMTLAAANATPYVARIDGIPVGSDCRIVEGATDAVSVDYAPAAPTGTGALVTVATAGSSTAAVPAGQRAGITNTFGTTSLRIVKEVDTAATVGTFGPFTFTLACAADTGSGIVPVVLDAADATFTLAAGGQKLVTGIPAPADCTLTETGSDHADRITVTTGSASATVSQGQAAPVVLGSAAEYTTTVANRYEAGTLAVRKVVTGGTSYGDAEFAFDVVCTYDSQTLLDTDITLEAGDTHTFPQRFPAGTSCSIVETDAGGATTAAPDRTVIIPAPTGSATLGTVTAVMTNEFATGSVSIQKQRTGAGAADFGAGPFTVVLACTWERDGDTLTIPLPAGGEVVLDATNGYAATVTGLIAGADCAVTEPDDGAATATTLGAVPTVVAGSPVTVTVTNRFDVGELHIVKVREGEGVARWGDGPFEVDVFCGYDRDGTWVDIDLGADATQELTAANGYEATIGGLLVGAECTVDETDAGFAIASEDSTDDAPAVIPGTGAAEVTVTNTFLLGWLDIEKTASETIVEGDTEFDYTLAVSNPGHIDAAGVHVEDELDADLHYESVLAAGWTCAVTGADADGYGGTLDCDYDTVLAAGDDATDIVVTVTVRPDIEKDDIPNAAVVTSTTPQVDGDDDDITTPVKWLDVTAAPQCVRDAPWLYYDIDARNVDLDGKTLTIAWNAPDGSLVRTSVIELTSALIGSDGVIHSRILWPGAAVDADEYGILWPGYRKALAGETTDYEELVFDASLPEAALRADATVTFSINPEMTVEAQYPPMTTTCADTLGPRDAGLWITKDADRSIVSAGDTFGYTIEGGNDGYGAATDVVLEDPIPATLQVLGVNPAAPATATDPAWSECTITGRDDAGYGGLLHCELDRPLGVGERTPPVALSVRLSPTAAAGPLVNVAQLTGVEVEGDPVRAATLPTLSVDDDAVVLSLGTLPNTGAGGWVLAGAAGALALLLGGAALLVLLALRRRRTA